MNRRATFGPVVLLGLGSAALVAAAGQKAMLEVPVAALRDSGVDARIIALVGDERFEQMPLVGALALVVLAAWGVVLVTRGCLRRVTAVVAAVAVLGMLASLAHGVLVGDRDFAQRFVRELGIGDQLGTDALPVHTTGWFLTAVVASIVALAASVAAAALAPYWPEMGTKYDAPTGAAAGLPVPGEASNIDLWKSLDAGQDPTIGPDEPRT